MPSKRNLTFQYLLLVTLFLGYFLTYNVPMNKTTVSQHLVDEAQEDALVVKASQSKEIIHQITDLGKKLHVEEQQLLNLYQQREAIKRTKVFDE